MARKNNQFLHSRGGLVLLGLLSLAVMWLLGLRATDTGSLQQYAGVIALLIFGVNRLVKAVRVK